nr:type II toxin-antitoxin system HipA family toxin [Microvirga puerhi]
MDVWFDGQCVGQLERRSEAVTDIVFRYAPAWIDAQGSFPISITMPLAAVEHDPVVVYPWFLNLLPEGGALQAVGNILQVHEMDVFGMLAEMGRDLPGALDIRRPGTDTKAFRPHYHRLSEAELADALRRLPERPLLVGEDGVHMSVAGAQEKLPVVRYRDGGIGLALDGAPSTHILKPRNDRFRASVENEAFCLRLAAAVGLPAAKVTMQRAEDVDYLLVERYDRIIQGGRVQRLHQEDLCQATGFPPYLKYEWNASIAKHGPGLKLCMDALAGTPAPAPNKLRFFEAMLFNVLCGNVDAHAKNYSLLIRSGSALMAPIYDVMNGDIYENVTRNLAMKIANKQRGGHIYARHWNRFAEENGLSASGVRRRVAELSQTTLNALPGVIAEMESSNMPSPVYREIAGYVAAYCRNMLGNLKQDPGPGAADADDETPPAEPTGVIGISP